MINCNPSINTLVIIDFKNKSKNPEEESIDQKIPILTRFSLCLVQYSMMPFTCDIKSLPLIPKLQVL